MRKVLIATPCYSGHVDVWYCNALVNTIRESVSRDIFLHPVWMSYDALVQRARNDLIALAVEGGYDDMIFIDADMEWSPEWIFSLLDRPEEVVGGTARKKTDDEIYVVKTKTLAISENGLIQVDSLGTGFVKLSRTAFLALWNNSPVYKNAEKSGRMVCDVQIIDGELYSEDVVLFHKLTTLGFTVWLDPHMTCSHIGTRKFTGNFMDYLMRLKHGST